MKFYLERVKKGILSSTLVLFVFFAIVGGFGYGIVKGLLIGVMLTMFVLIPFQILYSLIDYLFLTKAFKKYGRIDYGLHQLHSMKIKFSKDEAFNYVLKAMNKYKGIQDIEVDKRSGIIKARRKAYWKTQGENIKIIVTETSSISSIEIHSRPRRKLAYWDFAQNYQNVEIIANYIKNQLSGVGGVTH